MKKTIVLSIAVLYLICTALTAFAAPTTEPARYVKDSANDIVNVSGGIDATEFVTLLVLNPGKTESDINFADSEAMAAAVQYMGSYWAEGGSYSFDVPMHGEAGGVYTIIVTAGGVKYATPVTIEFYFAEEKKSIIADINDEENFDLLMDLVDEAYCLYSLGEDKLYVNGNLTETTKVIEKTRDENGDYDDQDVSEFAEILKKSAIVGAYNAGLDNVVLVDDLIDYTSAELLNLDGTDEYNDYINLISEDGREAIHEDLILNGEEYDTVEDISNKFRELVAYYGIIENEDAGYGHVQHYIDTYADVYEDAGFKLNKLRDDEKNRVFKALVKAKTNDLGELKTVFNKLVTDDGDDGGSTSSTTGTFSPATPVTSPSDTNYITPSKFFVDLESVQWAEESIIALANMGIVSGKGNNNFAPNDYVTRAEFLKMLMGALKMTTSNGSTNFADVPADHWASSYVAAAVSNGVANGVTTTEFAPNGFVTREMAAAFSARAMEKSGVALTVDTAAFADEAYISDWAKVSVSGLKNAGILTGSGDNMFNPKDNLTRAQAAKIIYGIMSSMGLVQVAE